MEKNWQVTLFAGVPVWQYGNLIEHTHAPDGQKIPFLMCSTVVPLATGFVELTVAEEGTTPVLTLLVPTQHVMCAIHLKQRNQTGFARPAQKMASGMKPAASALPADAPPSSAGA